MPKPVKTSWNSAKLFNEIQDVLSNTDEIIVYDLETTGLKHTSSSIIEIAAIRYRVDSDYVLHELDTYHTYIRPKQWLDAKIVEITGITDEFLVDKPAEDEVADDIIKFFGDYPVLAGYNTESFDNRFLACLFERRGKALNIKGNIDALRMARDRIEKSEVENYKLETVGKYFNISFNAHSALEDTRATAQLIQLFLAEYKSAISEGEIHKNGDTRPYVKKVSYWQGYKGRSRIYAETSAGTVYYDIFTRRWGEKDVDLNMLDMEYIESEAWRLTGSINEPTFSRFTGCIKNAM